MRKIYSFAALLALLLGSAVLALSSAEVQARELTGTGKAIRLTIDVQKVEEFNKSVSIRDGKQVEEPARKAESKDSISVLLFPDLVAVNAGGMQTIYDFKSRQLTTLNLDAKTYFISALYAVPMFHIMEKSNQTMMLKAFSKSGIKPPGMPGGFDMDMNFGGDYDRDLAKSLKSATENGKTVFTYNGEMVAEYQLSSVSVPELFKPAYRRFLAYNTTVHPVIFSDLKAQPVFLQEMTFVNKRMAPEKVLQKLSISRIEDADDPRPSIPGNFKPDPKVGAYPVVTAALGTLPAFTKNVEKINALYGNKQYLDAAISFIGHSLVYGVAGIEHLSPAIQGAVNEADPESGVRQMLKICSTQPEKSGAEKSIQEIMRIQSKSPDYGYMLNGCLALYYQTAGRLAEAQKVRMAALEKNPYLVAVMKDLGDGYYISFNTFHAWAYWNLARQMNPSFDVAQKVTQMEAKVSSDRPDFF